MPLHFLILCPMFPSLKFLQVHQRQDVKESIRLIYVVGPLLCVAKWLTPNLMTANNF